MPKTVYYNGLYPLQFPDEYTDQDIEAALATKEFRPNDSWGNIAMNIGNKLKLHAEQKARAPKSTIATPSSLVGLNQHQIDQFNENYQRDAMHRNQLEQRRSEAMASQQQAEATRQQQTMMQEDRQQFDAQKMDRQRQEKMLDASIGKIVNTGEGEQRHVFYDESRGGMQTEQVVAPRSKPINLGGGVVQIYNPSDPAEQTYQIAPPSPYKEYPITKYGYRDVEGNVIPGSSAPAEMEESGPGSVDYGRRQAQARAAIKSGKVSPEVVAQRYGLPLDEVAHMQIDDDVLKDAQARLDKDIANARAALSTFTADEKESKDPNYQVARQKFLDLQNTAIEVENGVPVRKQRGDQSVVQMDEKPKPKDSRTTWQKVAPTWLGGKEDPTAPVQMKEQEPTLRVPAGNNSEVATMSQQGAQPARKVVDGIEVVDNGDGTVTLPNGHRARKVGDTWQLVK